jgi:molybdopterin-containing oxidoreductase family membrane subunit
MADDRYLMGLFLDENGAVDAVGALGESSFRIEKVFSPVPSHRLAHALKVKKSWVGVFTLFGGMFGFFAGFLLAIFTASRWDLIVSGKPVISLIPFLIVGFEFTILFAVFGNFIGFLFLTDLPRSDWRRHYDERLSGRYYGVLAACPADREHELAALLERQGADVRRMDRDDPSERAAARPGQAHP